VSALLLSTNFISNISFCWTVNENDYDKLLSRSATGAVKLASHTNGLVI